jgi:hypothetical protein
MVRRTALIAVLLCAVVSTATPHSGGTNADGCHTDHRTGDYHCHTRKEPVYGAETYCHVVQGTRRCGYSRNTCQDLVSEYGGYCQRE